MLEDLDEFLDVVDRVYGGRSVPKPFQMLRAVRLAKEGGDAAAIAKSIKTTTRHLQALIDGDDPLALALKLDRETLKEEQLRKARLSIGQLLLGQIAERVFEEIYKATMGTTELRLEDSREARSDTDYRVYNGSGFPVFRINIKFHGSQFREAPTLVKLEAADCFALATYKIFAAVQKQEKEHLPYLFVVVGVPNLTREVTAAVVPDELAYLVAMMSDGRRDVEDAVVSYLLGPTVDAAVAAKIAPFTKQIEQANWTVCSARRADILMRELLFERVYALRVIRFAQNYRRAEVDMHFSNLQRTYPSAYVSR